jgi:hypothetical protein
VIFSEKTSIRAGGAYENPRKRPGYVLEKVADARKTPENQAFAGNREGSKTRLKRKKRPAMPPADDEMRLRQMNR